MPLIKTAPKGLKGPRAPKGAPQEDPASAEAALGLESADPAARRCAVRTALERGEGARLAANLAAEPDRSVREAIFNGLARCNDPASARPLLDLLKSDDAALRSAVIETLQIMGEALVPEIEALLADPDPDLRLFGLNILQAVQSPRTSALALSAALGDDNVNVCAAAVEVLAAKGTPDMADALRTVPARFPQQSFLAFAVRAALKRIG
jgi:HEAT repeat protein